MKMGGDEDLRKRKRKESNRESARRCRMRKQKLLDELMAKSAQIEKENNQVRTSIEITTENYLKFEAENSVLRARYMELTQRLQSLNEIIATAGGGVAGVGAGAGTGGDWAEESFMNSPWSMMYYNQQPIVASADAFDY